MIDLAQVHEKPLGMVAWGKNATGEDDVVVLTGIADWDGRRLRMLRQGGEVFEVPREFWERIQAANAEVGEVVMGAEFCFSVTVGDVADGAGLELTGLKWPSERRT